MILLYFVIIFDVIITIKCYEKIYEENLVFRWVKYANIGYRIC